MTIADAGVCDGERVTDRLEWQRRAAHAEYAVLDRYVRRLPAVAWARSAWPALGAGWRRRERRAGWHYWWSAHLVDAAIDAARHRPGPGRLRRPRVFARGIRLRNGGTWSRPFWDDLAWLGLAFERGGDLVGGGGVAERIARRLETAIDPSVGAIPWRVGSLLFNAPANGPAAILLARTGRTAAATRLADWMHEQLIDPETGLVFDGLVVDGSESETVTALYPYCQGVALGAYVAQSDPRFRDRAADLVHALSRWVAPSGVLPGSGGGDGGLFAGIACRYLAEAVPHLEGEPAASARRIVLASADAAWRGAAVIDRRPLFAADWRHPAETAVQAPERDLSVQLGAWLALEAAVDASPSASGG